MERKIIESVTANLPYSPLEAEAADHEIWEGQDGEAMFKVTRHILSTPNNDTILVLSVSGPMNERQRVISEFIEVYGQPAVPIDSEPYMDTVSWLYPEAS